MEEIPDVLIPTPDRGKTIPFDLLRLRKTDFRSEAHLRQSFRAKIGRGPLEFMGGAAPFLVLSVFTGLVQTILRQIRLL